LVWVDLSGWENNNETIYYNFGFMTASYGPVDGELNFTSGEYYTNCGTNFGIYPDAVSNNQSIYFIQANVCSNSNNTVCTSVYYEIGTICAPPSITFKPYGGKFYADITPASTDSNCNMYDSYS